MLLQARYCNKNKTKMNFMQFICVLTNFSCSPILFGSFTQFTIQNIWITIFYVYLILLLFFFFCSLCLLTGTCNAALGMESGAIADFQITASSAHDPGNVGPQHARYVFLVWVFNLLHRIHFSFLALPIPLLFRFSFCFAGLAPTPIGSFINKRWKYTFLWIYIENISHKYQIYIFYIMFYYDKPSVMRYIFSIFGWWYGWWWCWVFSFHFIYHAFQSQFFPLFHLFLFLSGFSYVVSHPCKKTITKWAETAISPKT